MNITSAINDEELSSTEMKCDGCGRMRKFVYSVEFVNPASSDLSVWTDSGEAFMHFQWSRDQIDKGLLSEVVVPDNSIRFHLARDCIVRARGYQRTVHHKANLVRLLVTELRNNFVTNPREFLRWSKTNRGLDFIRLHEKRWLDMQTSSGSLETDYRVTDKNYRIALLELRFEVDDYETINLRSIIK